MRCVFRYRPMMLFIFIYSRYLTAFNKCDVGPCFEYCKYSVATIINCLCPLR